MEVEAGFWAQSWSPRGWAAEKLMGKNLHDYFPGIDHFSTTGIATSMKSMGLHLKSYQKPKNINSKVEKYVDEVANFHGNKFAGYVVRSEDITGRALDLAIPHAGNPAQQEAIKAAIDYATTKGVKLNITILKERKI